MLFLEICTVFKESSAPPPFTKQRGEIMSSFFVRCEANLKIDTVELHNNCYKLDDGVSSTRLSILQPSSIIKLHQIQFKLDNGVLVPD